MTQRHPLASAAAAAAIVSLAWASTGPTALAQGGAPTVPWLDAPAAAPGLAPVAPAVAAPPCAAGDLSVLAGQQGAWHGFATQELRLSKTGAGACVLAGAPAFTLVGEDGTRRAVPAGAAPPEVAGRSVTLAPAADALLLVGAPGSCDAAAGERREVFRRLELAPAGGGFLAVEGVHVDTLCGEARVVYLESVVDEARHAAQADPAAAARRALTARIEAPATAVRGQPLRYVVTLVNHGDTALALAPCPSYAQSLHVEGRSVDSRHLLNCAGAGGALAPHASVSFAMQAAVPADLAGSSVKLSWTLQDGPGVGTIAALR
jgi:hypothetical protein